jgi:hypothetical protein
MQKSEWLTCAHLRAMLDCLHKKIPPRKIRLWACACCRRVWEFVIDPRSRQGVGVAEQAADGYADEAALQSASTAAAAAEHDALRALESLARRTALAWRGLGKAERSRRAREQAILLSRAEACAAVCQLVRLRDSVRGLCRIADTVARRARRAVVRAAHERLAEELALQESWNAVKALRWRNEPEVNAQENAAQAALLRDVAGTPPFAPMRFDPAWRTADVLSLATALVERRHFAALPVLADALVKAGYREAALLEHLRSDGPHTYGCWAIDAILART